MDLSTVATEALVDELASRCDDLVIALHANSGLDGECHQYRMMQRWSGNPYTCYGLTQAIGLILTRVMHAAVGVDEREDGG